MSKVLVGVGGSGQHVAHAYLRMLALARCRPINVPHIYIIDADAKIGGSGRGDTSLCTEIKRLHNQLVAPLPPESRSHFALVKPYFQLDAESQPGRADAAFDLTHCPAYLRDAFLTDEIDLSSRHADSNDRSVDLMQGMMANAKIGAIAFGFKILRSGNDENLKSVNFGYADHNLGVSYSLLRDVDRARVAIVGSTFGGTGSGVIPALVRYLSSLTTGAPLAIRAFMTLPWFDIEAGGDSAAAVRQDGIDPKTRNAALGLRTYLDELDSGMARANYVVSQFPGSNAKRLDRGNSNQGEDPHVFNLVMATSIQQFLWDPQDTGAVTGAPEKRKLFGMIATRDEEAAGRFDAERSAHLRFRVRADDNLQLLDIIKEAEVLALALEKGAEFITPGEGQFTVKGADPREEPTALTELCKNVATTYDKRKLVKRRGAFLMKKDVAPPEVYGKLADAMRASAMTIRQSLVWLDSHKTSETSPQGLTSPRVDHLFEQKQNADRSFDIVPVDEASLVSRWAPFGLKVHSKQTRTDLDDRTPRISQACSLFMNCFFSANDYPNELMILVENQPGSPVYAVVADMLAQAVHKEVIEARSSTRSVEFSKDVQDSAPPQQVSYVFVRNLRIDARPESSRLCVVDKAMLDSSIGDKDRADYQSPIHETHPLSLRQIDPYLGVSRSGEADMSALYTLAEERGTLPEAALKGIPNVLAPKLLQQWRLARRAFSEGKNPVVSVPGRRMLQSSEYGLYLHACRVVEAAFWLLFTRDHRVELNEYPNLDDVLRQSLFAKLINQEMKALSLLQAQNLLPKKAIALRDPSKRQEGKVVFVNDPATGWFLAANSMARQFFAQLMPELPSVRYGKSDLDHAWRGGKGHVTVAAPEKGSYEANMITAFHAFLKKEVSAYRNSGLPWANALVDICEMLEPLVDPTAPAPTMSTGPTVQLINESGALEDMQLRSPSALSNMKNLFIEQPVYFFVGDEEHHQDEWAGLWPLRGAAWEHVIVPDRGPLPNPMTMKKLRGSDAGTNERSVWEVLSIRLNLRDLGSYSFRQPFGAGTRVPGSSEKIDSLPWAAAVWPNFKAKDWRSYLAGGYWRASAAVLEDFDLKGASFTAADWCLVFYGESTGGVLSVFEEIGRVEKRMPTKLRGIPRSVEVVINGRVLGSMPIRLVDIPESTQDARCDLAIDFGTSNTCMAIKRQGQSMPEHLALLANEPLPSGSGAVLPDFTALIGPAKVPGEPDSIAERQFRNPQSPLFFFQSFNKPDKKSIPRSVPSELINLKSQDIVGITAYLEQSARSFENSLAIDSELAKRPSHVHQAMVAPHFTPFPPNPGGVADGTDLAQFLGSGLHRDFKWPDPEGEEDDNIGLRAVYLEQMLLAGCATLRWSGIRDVKRLVVTYPGAFTPNYRDKYFDDLGRIVDSVFAATGVKLKSEKLIKKSETIAALAAADPGGTSMKVTIDMGGGTTDVGVIVPGMQSGEKPYFSYMTSLRYAGNQLLKALLKSPKLRDTFNASETDSNKLDRLKIMIRSGSSKLATPSVAKVAEAFFEGLFEYVFTLIAAVTNSESFPKGKRIDIYLFGNGFKLTEVFLGTRTFAFFDSVLREAVGKGLLSQEVAATIRKIENDRDTKLDLIQGALKGSLDETDNEETAVDVLLHEVENSGHSRVPIWYPSVIRDGRPFTSISLGTAEERLLAQSERTFRDGLSVDAEDLSTLKASFPITSRYWDGTDAVGGIFNNAPRLSMLSLGQFYLEGNGRVPSSYAEKILPQLALQTSRPIKDTRY